MNDVVVDALSRIEAAEEAAAFDEVKVKSGDKRRNHDWTIDSEIIGTVKQADVPRLMTDALADVALVYGGCRKLAARLGVSSPRSLRGYADNEYKMNYTVGQRFVYYLEQQAKKSGAAPAATDTAPKEQTTTEASAAIVSQEVDTNMGMVDAQHEETQREVEQLTRERDALRQRVNDLELVRDLLRRLLAVNAL